MDPEKLGQLTLENLKDICGRHMRLSHINRRTRASLYAAISGQHVTVQQPVNAEVGNTIQSGIGKKRKESDGDQGSRK
jgi:hypothetical protein